jgi:hypothetical protein
VICPSRRLPRRPGPGGGACAALLALALAAAAPAAAAERAAARNGMFVAGDAEGFEVFPRGGAGGAELFCAAGDFARRHLGAAATDRVEIAAPLGPSAERPGLRAVRFVLRPAGTGANRGLDRLVLRPWRPGVSRSVAHAVALCEATLRNGGGD